MDIRIRGLQAAPFRSLLENAVRGQAGALATLRTVDAVPGFPCRVGLDDAALGETVLLTHYTHQDAATPFRASHAIYVRAGAGEAYDAVNAVPPALARRTLSLRAFDAEGWLRDARLAPGTDTLAAARELLARPGIAYLHAHYAAMGCYAAWIGRADGGAAQAA